MTPLDMPRSVSAFENNVTENEVTNLFVGMAVKMYFHFCSTCVFLPRGQEALHFPDLKSRFLSKQQTVLLWNWRCSSPRAYQLYGSLKSIGLKTALDRCPLKARLNMCMGVEENSKNLMPPKKSTLRKT